MLLYVAFVSATNLCLGYALGVYLGEIPGILPAGPRTAGRKKKSGSHSSQVPTGSLPATIGAQRSGGETDQAVVSTADALVASQDDEGRSPGSDPESMPAEEQRVVQGTGLLTEGELDTITNSSDAADSNSEHPPSATSGPQAEHAEFAAQVDLDSFRDGLDAYQEQLAKVDLQLQSEAIDRAALVECVSGIHVASDDYVKQSHKAFDRLAPVEGDSTGMAEDKLHVKQAIMDQVQRVKEHDQQIDELDLANNASAAQSALQETSSALAAEAGDLQAELARIFAQAADGVNVADPMDDNATPSRRSPQWNSLRQMEEQIGRFLETADATTRLPVALLELDNLDDLGLELETASRGRLLSAIEQVVDSLTSADHCIAREGSRFLFSLAGESADSTTQLLEQIRQRVESAVFKLDGRELNATVSCGVAEAHQPTTFDQMWAHLEEALQEAQRFGSNRIFWHDGSFATPVAPPGLQLEPLIMEI